MDALNARIAKWNPDLVLNPNLRDLEIVFSEKPPNTDPGDPRPLGTTQLHELAILREQGFPRPWAFGVIRAYFIKEYECDWTTEQVVAVWRKLRQEHEKNASTPAGHVLHIWKRNLDEVADAAAQTMLKQLRDTTMKRFFAVMESDLDTDSSIELDIELENHGEDGVTVLTIEEIKEGFAKQARPNPWTKHEIEIWGLDAGYSSHFFAHPRAGWNGHTQIVVGLFRVERKKAWRKDLAAWRLAFARGETVSVTAPIPEKREYKRTARNKIARHFPKMLEALDKSQAVGLLEDLPLGEITTASLLDVKD
ncbi:MAG: hypothetical protein Q9168_002911 [Polycauliona sp. 1 TL-2023]